MHDEQDSEDILDRQLLAKQLGDMGFQSADVLADAAGFCFRLIPDSDDFDPENEEVVRNLTRLGGIPDVEEGFQWPLRGGRPLAFLGQVQLPEEDLLLSFFYDSEECPIGAGPEDGDSCQIFRFRIDNLSPCSPPSNLDPSYRYPVKEVAFLGDVTLPDSKSMFFHLEDFPSEDLEILTQLEESSEEENRPFHQLLGHPAIVLQDMEIQCAMIQRGLRPDALPTQDDKAMDSLFNESSEWMLLAQFDTDPDLNWNWIDEGRLFFWIKFRDFENNDFSNVLCIPQFPMPLGDDELEESIHS